MFRSNSPADPALCPPLDPASASLQMSKSKSNSETVLSPVAPVHPSSSSSGSKSRDFADVLTLASSVQSTQRRLSGFQTQIQCHTGSDTPTPVCVGRIIYDTLLYSASNETSRSWLKVWPSSMTTATWKLTSVESIPTPVVDPFSSLQLPALTSTISVGLPNSIELTSATINAGTTNSKYTSLHTTPPSPSLSDSYVRAHPGEVEVLDVTRLDVTVGLGPSLSVWEPSPSSPRMLGSAHISGVSPNLQVPPRLVVVNPTPNLTPHPTPPASPLTASVFTSASSASASTSHSNNHNGFGGMEGNWLSLPPNHFPNRMQDPQTHDRSRSDSVPTSAVTATDINFVSSSSFSLPQSSQPPPHHQSVEEDQLLASSQSFVQDLEMSVSSPLVFRDEASEMEEPRKTVKDGDMWINDVPVGSPVEDVDAQPMSKVGETAPSMTLRLDSLSTVHSMLVRKGGDEDEDSAADLEELDEATRLMNAANTAAAAATKKKKVGIRRKVKTKTIPLKRNSLRSPTSTLSPPLPAALHQSTSSSSTNQKQGTAVPPMARPKSNGGSSSRSMSQSGRSSFGVGVGTNGSVSRSRSREIQGASLGMTGLTRAASGERRKPVIAVSTKLKNRPKFMLGSKSKGNIGGKIVSGGSTMIRRESSGGNPGGSGVGGTEENADNERERERERGRERMIAMEIIQMQRRQQLLIQQQQQQQLEMKQREDEQRALVAQLARQDADVHEAEIRTQRQRLHHEQRQEQEVQREKNGLLGVSAKRPVKFNIEPNSDEGSGVGSNSKNGSEVSGTERLISPVDPIVNGIRQPHQLGIIQQQHTVAPHHHPVPHHPAPHHYQQLKSEKQLERQIIREEEVAERQLQREEKGKRRDHSNPNPNTKHSTHETLNMVSSALAAKVKHTLADPLLPGQHKRTIVLTTSESEYEHSDDDGSWSSEEMGSEDEEVSFLLRYISHVWNLISPFFYYRKGEDRSSRGKIGCWLSNNSNGFNNHSSNIHLLCSVHTHLIIPLLLITITTIPMQPTVRSALSPLVATDIPLATPKVKH